MNDNIIRSSPSTAGHSAPDRTAGDRLVAELERLGLRYLSRGPLPGSIAPLEPEELIIGLASSPEARLQLALIPLFLWRPDYATAALNAADGLADRSRVMLQCCYSAAVALQPRYARRLGVLGCPAMPLADIFASELELPPRVDPVARLAAVAARHAQLSGEPLNWLGTYEHAANSFMRFSIQLTA